MFRISRSVPAREIPEIGRDTSRRSLAVISITSAVVMTIAPCALEPDRAGETGDPTEPRRDQSRRISASKPVRSDNDRATGLVRKIHSASM